ncbi:MaoC family dehydratase [Paraburkholderia caribensis]|uniref:MaoC family dehydratase n=1 Tax=Paraburkholderia caribensis TaxID=75105 RepID=UPI0034D22F07
MEKRLIYLEDLVVGSVFESAIHPVDAEKIKEFARQFDPQPFHVDEDAAVGTFFGGLAASGWHTAAITMKLLVESLPLSGGVIGAGSDISWPQPTRPGDILRVVSTIMDVTPSRSKPDRGIVKVQSDTLNQDGGLCQRSVARLVVFRRDRQTTQVFLSGNAS